MLTIRGERREEEAARKVGDRRDAERRFGAFWRTLALPAGVDPGKVTATFKNGVLEVHLPKTRTVKGKTVEVKAG
jgi:HSP20 family protein